MRQTSFPLKSLKESCKYFLVVHHIVLHPKTRCKVFCFAGEFHEPLVPQVQLENLSPTLMRRDKQIYKHDIVISADLSLLYIKRNNAGVRLFTQNQVKRFYR